MLNSELMAQPSGSRVVVDCPNDQTLRFLHWLGYFPERIDGPRQILIKTLAPGFVMQALPAEHATYLSAIGFRREADRNWSAISVAVALLALAAVGLTFAKI